MATPSPSKSANSGSRKLAQVPGNLTPLPKSLTAQISRSRAPSGSESVISRAGDNMLRRRVMELECEVRQIKSHHQIDKEVMNDKIRMLEEQIAEYEGMIEEQEAALAQDPTESEAYKIMSSSLEGKIRELLVSNKEANNKIHELEALIGRGKAAELKNAELVKEKKDLESQITKIKDFHRQDMNRASEEVKAVKGRLTETRDECEALRGQVEQLQAAITKLEKTLSEAKNSNTNLVQDIEALRNEAFNHNKQLDDAKTELQKSQAEVARVMEHNKTLLGRMQDAIRKQMFELAPENNQNAILTKSRGNIGSPNPVMAENNTKPQTTAVSEPEHHDDDEVQQQDVNDHYQSDADSEDSEDAVSEWDFDTSTKIENDAEKPSDLNSLVEPNSDVPQHTEDFVEEQLRQIMQGARDNVLAADVSPDTTRRPSSAASESGVLDELESVSAHSSVSKSAPMPPWNDEWNIGELPERFEEIREITFNNIPDDVDNFAAVFKQLSTGMIEQVALVKGSLHIVFIDPVAAREQYIELYHRGLYIPKSGAPPQTSATSVVNRETGMDSLADNRVFLPQPFEYTPYSRPPSAALQKAVKEGLTRVLLMHGMIPGLKVRKVASDIIRGVPGIPNHAGFVFEHIQIKEEQELVVIRFTSMFHCARVYNGLHSHCPQYKDFRLEYGKDPCDQAPACEPSSAAEPAQENAEQQDEAEDSEATQPEHHQKSPKVKQEHRSKTPEIQSPKPIRVMAPFAPDSTDYVERNAVAAPNDIKKDMQEEEVKELLVELAKRGKVPERILREQGILPPAVPLWDVNPPTESKQRWNPNDIPAFKGPFIGNKKTMVARPTPETIPVGTPIPMEDYTIRTVCISGLPERMNYATLMPFIRGGAIDCVRLNVLQRNAFVLFLRAKDAMAYRDYLLVNEVTINGHRIRVLAPNAIRLNSIRIYNPFQVFHGGLSRCLFVKGITRDISPAVLKIDLSRMNPTMSLEYECVIVGEGCARIRCTSIAVAEFIHHNLHRHSKYAGAITRYELDPCTGNVFTIGHDN